MKRATYLVSAVLAATALFAGCTAATSTEQTSAVSGDAAASYDSDLAPKAVMAENADYTTVNTDEWNQEDAEAVELLGDTAQSDSTSVSVDGSTVTITEAGVYTLSGSLDGQVVVDAPEDAQVVLILDGAEISSPSGAGIEVISADDAAIHLSEGSENSVTDSAEDSAADANAAIWSDADLTISGSGALTVNANVNDGITSKDDLVILDGILTVTAADDALRGKDSLVVEGGTLELEAQGGDGMKSDGDEGDDDIDWTQGLIYVAGGTIDITAGDDGLQAFTDTVIAGGEVTIDAADDGVKAEAIVSIGEIEDENLESPVVTVTGSEEGLEAASVAVTGGTVDVTAHDDGLNASGNAELQAMIEGAEYTDSGQDDFADTGEILEISGGSLTVDAEGDGLDSNGSLEISGGDITVYGPTTGGNGSLDAAGEITVTGGSLVSFGPGSMEETPGDDSQGWVLVETQLAAGTSGSLVDSDGTAVAKFTAEKDATTVIVSSPEVVAGETYTVTVDGEDAGSAVAGAGGSGMGEMGAGGEMGGPGQGAPGTDDGMRGPGGTPPQGMPDAGTADAES